MPGRLSNSKTRLEPHHAKVIRSNLVYWKECNATKMLSWIEQRIKKLPTAAVYLKDNPSQPVSWVMPFSSRQIGSFHTLNVHRKKGLDLVVTAALCERLLDDAPDIPPLLTAYRGSKSLSISSKLGFKDQN